MRSLTFPQYYDLCDYWRTFPPEHELLTILVSVFTTWEPNGGHVTEEEHRASLERRWASGQYMTPKQMLEAMGGSISQNGGPGAQGELTSDGTMPGVGPFPGSPAARRLLEQQSGKQ